jgi:hypothetical protein
MPKVAVYTRATTGGTRRRYVKATRGSTGPFFLRYEINGRNSHLSSRSVPLGRQSSRIWIVLIQNFSRPLLRAMIEHVVSGGRRVVSCSIGKDSHQL